MLLRMGMTQGLLTRNRRRGSKQLIKKHVVTVYTQNLFSSTLVRWMEVGSKGSNFSAQRNPNKNIRQVEN